MSVSEKVLDAIEILTDNFIKKAGYDRTIQAQIVSCEDATIGKYKCRYQDAVFYAYSNGSEMTFTNGSSVYILIPGNDMSQQKTIIGSTKKLGVNYINSISGDEAYDIIGNNCIVSNDKFYLNTLNKNYKYTIYDANNINTNNINVDIQSLQQYIKQSSSIIIGATFKTSIASEKQYRGSYGIIYNLKFIDNTSNKEIIRSYTINEDSMIDNPYRLIYQTRQYQIFPVDGLNFLRFQSIQIFNKDFPGAIEENNNRLTSGDIEITKLELECATKITEQELNGIFISFYTPQGTFFTETSTEKDVKTITAQIKVKGKLVSSLKKVPFYWGVENVKISTTSQYYNKYLGKGWKCLNTGNIVAEKTDTEDAIIEWAPAGDTITVNYLEATAKNNKFKVAIIYENNVITKQINIQNLTSSIPTLKIESDSGTKFYYDIGHPTLTCKVIIQDTEQNQENYNYYWAYESNTGVFEQLPETIDFNNQYNIIKQQLDNLNNQINAGTAFINTSTAELNELKNRLKEFNYIQRVENNKIYDVQINNIITFGTFKCSVYSKNENNTYLGTASIILINKLEEEDIYTLIINNGNTVFKYNENGVAPDNSSLEIPQKIQALNFTLYNNLGQPIDNDILINSPDCNIKWEIPIKNTMLVDKMKNQIQSEDIEIDQTETYRYYTNISTFIYGISSRYDIRKQRNQIKLSVNYKGLNLIKETQFTFTKQGESGTNGTQYIVKIVPNTIMNNPPSYPMVTLIGSSDDDPNKKYELNYGLGNNQSTYDITRNLGYNFFKAQLWYNGDLFWQGITSTSGKNGPSSVTWEILRNKYTTNIYDESLFTIDKSDNYKFFYNTDYYTIDNLRNNNTPYANIVKCSIVLNGKSYYGTIPITTAWVYSSDYKIELKEYTGFRYVIYDKDGTSPQYDTSNPFEFIINKKIDDTWEDISNVQGNNKIDYTVTAVGNYRKSNISEDNTKENTNLIEILSQMAEYNNNQWRAKPASRYDGLCVNEAIICLYKNNEINIGKINIPIHLYIYKYGMTSIDAWDGNSIQINENGGYILAPQMGAGTKDDNNNFTGVLMGWAKDFQAAMPDVGLFGYANGYRSFFLNSNDGSATFGKQGLGQIIIKPGQDKAQIKSGNYEESNQNGTGLLIDLTKPEIKYGSKLFYVTSQGVLHATNAIIDGTIISGNGQIGGWILGPNSLHSGSGEGDYVELNSDSTSDYVFYSNNFKIEHDGTIIATSADIQGGSINIESTSSEETKIELHYWGGGHSAVLLSPSSVRVTEGRGSENFSNITSDGIGTTGSITSSSLQTDAIILHSNYGSNPPNFLPEGTLYFQY